MDDRHVIASGKLRATIAADGAELVALATASGDELLWNAGPEWPRHAPVLFPIVGRLTDDTLIHDGKSHRLAQHGFARDSRFTWIERNDGRAVLELSDSEATRVLYPFAFVLRLTYAVSDATLTVTARIDNPGDAPLPCAIGAHPAFRWPLAHDAAQTDHLLEFSDPETGIRYPLRDGLLAPAEPLPYRDKCWPLSPDLFAQDAIVMPRVASRSLAYIARAADGTERRRLTLSWAGYRDLGLWSKPGGADFLCIEPWYGTASPAGWQGPFADKPGLLHLAPGETREFSWSVAVSG